MRNKYSWPLSYSYYYYYYYYYFFFLRTWQYREVWNSDRIKLLASNVRTAHPQFAKKNSCLQFYSHEFRNVTSVSRFENSNSLVFFLIFCKTAIKNKLMIEKICTYININAIHYRMAQKLNFRLSTGIKFRTIYNLTGLYRFIETGRFQISQSLQHVTL